MSDTDDTDILLIIPPDFFTIRSTPPADGSEQDDASIPSADFQNLFDSVTSHIDDIENKLSALKLETTKNVRPYAQDDEVLAIALEGENREPEDDPKNSGEKVKGRGSFSEIDDLFSRVYNEEYKNVKYTFPNSTGVFMEPVKNASYSSIHVGSSSSFVDAKSAPDVGVVGKLKKGNLLNSVEDAGRRTYEQNRNFGKRNEMCSDSNTFPFPYFANNAVRFSEIAAGGKDFTNLEQKLEAEICKRQHCENLIQALQRSLLEHEENLVLAIRINAEKDDIIETFKNAWSKLSSHWKNLEEQRHQLGLLLEQERAANRECSLCASKKIEELEAELSKSYEVVAEHEQNLDTYKTELQNLKEEVARLQTLLLNQTEEVALTKDENSSLQKEHETANQHVSELLERLGNLEKVVNILTQNNEELSYKLQERSSEVIEERNKAETAKQELNFLKEEFEKIKSALKNHYQNQLEAIVRDKLGEYQQALNDTQKVMQAEIQKREDAMRKETEIKLHHLHTLHKLEMQELQRKFSDEENLWEEKIREKEKKILLMESKLKEMADNKIQLAKRVQTMMQNQWIETLNLIASSEAPSIIGSKDPRVCDMDTDLKTKCIMRALQHNDGECFERDGGFSLGGKEPSELLKECLHLFSEQIPQYVKNKVDVVPNDKNERNQVQKNEATGTVIRKKPWK